MSDAKRKRTGRAQAGADDIFDVAIVGGGIAGAYAAWRLAHAKDGELGPKLKALAAQRGRNGPGQLRIGLFEYSERIGGRLFSLKLPGVDTPVELGGMRFLNSHEHVTALVHRLDLKFYKLEVEDPNQNHIFYLRGQHCTGADWARPSFEPAYRLDRGERARSPGQLLIEIALRHETSAARYRDTGFWNLLLDEYSSEAYQLIRDAGGYQSLVSNWCAADAIPFLLADFAPGSSYWALNDGYEELPRRLARDYEKTCGPPRHNSLRFCHRLHRLDREDGTDLIRLTFDTGDPAKFAQGRRMQREVRYRAHHVLLALPRRAIEMLHPDSFLFQGPAGERFEENLRAVLPQPALKIFAAYRRPWWSKTRHITAGRSVTDLPLRQCYYWVTGDGADEDDAPSILMASYNDGSSVEFWAGLARQPEPYAAPRDAIPPSVAPPFDLRGSGAPQALVDALQEQLRELHGLPKLTDSPAAEIIPPYAAVFHDWAQEPFGGGWHFWKIGADSAAIGAAMRKPFPDTRVHVCGEAWSRQQGWVEGALETTEEVLTEQLGLKPLSWIVRESAGFAKKAAARQKAAGAAAPDKAARRRPATLLRGAQNRSL